MEQFITAFLIGVTLSSYLLCRSLYLRFNHPLVNVVLLSAAIIIGTLLVCKLSYEAYIPGRDLMTFLLGPATVALAVPLYRNRHLLRKYAMAILVSVAAGSIVSMVSTGLIAKMGGLPREVVISIIPKGVTIPFAVEVAKIYGGEPALAAAFVVATGTLGSVIGLVLLTRSGIMDPVARGLAMGTVAHGQGTAMALMEGQAEGSMAGLAMTLAGIFTALFAPFIVPLIL
jgi:predicted murein hydrolase (TIGR00659 family)